MTRLFAVIQTRGEGWDETRPLGDQRDWPAHAAFMDALEAAGSVVLGGPLEGTPEVLLIMRAREAAEIRACLSCDPWLRTELLRLRQVVPWTLRLGSLGAGRPASGGCRVACAAGGVSGSPDTFVHGRSPLFVLRLMPVTIGRTSFISYRPAALSTLRVPLDKRLEALQDALSLLIIRFPRVRSWSVVLLDDR